jgi:CRISPR-associated endonuclease/helicase Cas3
VTTGTFDAQFAALTGLQPFRWQARLFRVFANGEVPSAIDLPTGLGKTSVMALWLLARARGAALPRRLIYVVDRRAVVDQATAEAEKLRHGLDRSSELKSALGLGNRPLPISTLRGQFVDNREWLADPAAPAIIVGTVDMIGSRLLFSGYGVSPKMRPYHAGLLGADGLIVLDEAHLVPPFARLLRAIQQDASLWPRDGADRELLPRVAFLPLSATQRDLRSDERGRAPFRLEEIDWETDCVVKKRLNAKKRVRLTPLAENGQDKQLAATAWALATKDGKISRVAVFCNRREKSDEGGGPSAQGVKDEIEKLARADKRAQRSEAKIYPPELLVGARRVHERDGVAKRLHELGFIGEKTPLEKPAFLLATSAGEVGVDVDAEHMVSDLTAWERMVQRLGRVNRRGEGNAEIHVFWGEPTIKSADRPTESEKRALCAHASRAVIEKLPQIGGLFDASPAALRTLAEGARKDGTLKALIDAATTPEPLRPALNRALVDAWSLTSLQTHTGRPEVAPWLRGWIDDVPQTRIIWRSHLPLRDGIPDWPRTSAEKKEIEDFFEAAAPHESERLETETYRVASWLQKRAQALLARKRSAPKKSIEDETIEGEAPPVDEADTEASDAEEGAGSAFEQLGRDEIVALMLSSSGAYAGRYNLGYLAQQRKGDAKTEFEAELTGRVLVVDAQLGGLKDGLLDVDSDALPDTADTSAEWSQQVGFRVRREAVHGELQDDWWFEDEVVLRRDTEGNAVEWLWIEHYREAALKEDARSIAKPQELAEHQDWTRREMSHIAAGVGLSGVAANALAIAAALHDEGKRAERWQRAFKAARDARRCGLSEPLAKTRGPIDQALLDGYRHEFGSLRHVEENAEFNRLPGEWHDLVLHLVAAHHGFARPVINTRGCDDGPPSSLEERARDGALRFARLQKQWGPWGLAWLEALLRAADAQASRDNDEGREPSDSVTAGKAE